MVPQEDYEFDKIVANAEAIARGNEEVMIKLVEETILTHFIQSSFAQKKHKKRVVHAPTTTTFSLPFIPKKARSSLLLHHKPNTKPNFQIAKRKHQLLELDDQPSSTSSPSSSSSKKKPGRVSVKHRRASNNSPPELPMEVKNRIESLGGSDVKLVIQKELFKTDMSKHHDRLAIPVKQLMAEFLEVGEKVVLEEKNAVAVRVLEPYLGETKALNLRQWKMTSSTSYVINGGWYDVTQRSENNMSVKDIIQVWSFRADGGLCFALVNLGLIEND